MINFVSLGGNRNPRQRPFNRGPNKDSVRIALAQLEQRQRESQAAEAGAGEDRQLRELALLLGADQNTAQLDLTRDQIVAQGLQFQGQLDALAVEGAADRDLAREGTAASTANLQTQLEAASNERALDRTADADARAADTKRFEESLKESARVADEDRNLVRRQIDDNEEFRDSQREFDVLSSTLQNELLNLNNSATAAGASAERVFRNTRESLGAASDAFNPRQANIFQSIQEIANDPDNASVGLATLKGDVESFARSINNAITDDSLSLEDRLGAALTLGGGDGPSTMRRALLEIRQGASSSDKTAINGILKTLTAMSKDSIQAAQLFGQINRELDPERLRADAQADINSQLVEQQGGLTGRAAELRGAILDQTSLADGGALVESSPNFDVAAPDLSRFQGGLDALAKQLGSGTPLPNAGGGGSKFDRTSSATASIIARRNAEAKANADGQRAAAAESLGNIPALLEQQNVLKQTGPLNIIRPDGQTVTLARELATPQELDRLRQAGFKIPGAP